MRPDPFYRLISCLPHVLEFTEISDFLRLLHTDARMAVCGPLDRKRLSNTSV